MPVAKQPKLHFIPKQRIQQVWPTLNQGNQRQPSFRLLLLTTPFIIVATPKQVLLDLIKPSFTWVVTRAKLSAD